jgi:AP-2 complex subunit alpha
MACIILYFSNKSPTAISSFTTTLDLDPTEKAKLTYDVKGLPESTIAEGAQSQQMVMFEAKSVFTKSPTIRISYLAGALQALTLAIPLTIHKFMEPAELTSEDFFNRWKQIGGAPREALRVFGIKGGRESDREINPEFVRSTVEGFKWGVLDGVDPNRKNFVGASVLHTSEGGKFGCLLRLEPNYETQVCTIEAITDRCTNFTFRCFVLQFVPRTNLYRP